MDTGRKKTPIGRLANKPTAKKSTSNLLAPAKASTEEESCDITQEELDEAEYNIALYRAIMAKKKKDQAEAKLRETFERAKKEEAKLKKDQRELSRKQAALAKMALLRKALKVCQELKSFLETVVMPTINNNRVPLNLSDEEFETLKGLLASIKSLIDDPECREAIESVLGLLDDALVGPHFITTFVDEKALTTDTIALRDQMKESINEISKLKEEISKYQDLLDKHAED